MGEAGTGTEAVAPARKYRPDVTLMDVRMPEVDGIEATRRILFDPGPSTAKVLILTTFILTTFNLDSYVFAALRAGGSGFLLKVLVA